MRRFGTARPASVRASVGLVRRACLAACEQLERRRLLTVSFTGDPAWVEQGPRPITGEVNVPPDGIAGGSVESIAVNPNNNAQIYVGTVNGGVWRTNNANPATPDATTWTPLTDQLSSLAIGDIAFSPLDATGNTVFAGTGSFSSLAQSGGSPIGILRTTDGGATWNTFPLTAGGSNQVKAVVPTAIDTDPGPGVQEVVLVGTIGGGGLYRSNNNGQTYTLLSGANGLPNSDISQLIVDPNNAQRFYAGLPNVGVYRGDYNGGTGVISWTNITSNITGAGTAGNIQVAAHNSGGTTDLWALVSGSSLGAFRSTNPGGAGVTWTALATPPALFSRDVTVRAGNTIVADPTNDQVAYIATYGGGDDIFRYNPAGAGSWDVIDNAGASGSTAPHADDRDLAFQGNNLVVSCDGGIYFINDPINSSANAWHSYIGGGGNGLGNVEFHDVAWDSRFDVIVGGAQDNGTNVQTAPGSKVWSNFYGGDGGDVAVDATTLSGANRSIRYVSSQNLDNFARVVVDSATNIVETVGLIPSGGLSGFIGQFVNPIAINPIAAPAGQSRRVVIGGGTDATHSVGKVYESNNAGVSADAASTNWTDVPTGTGFGAVSAIAAGGRRSGADNPDVLYVGSGSKVFVRSAAGGTLTATAANFPGSNVTDIALDPEDWQHAFVTSSNGVWETSDAGASWTNRTGDLSNGNIGTVEFVRHPGSDAVLVGGAGGVFRMLSNNPGVWTEFGRNMPNILTFDLEYSAADDVLLSGTLGRGAWTVPTASADLFTPGVMTVDGTGGDDTIRLILDPNNPSLLDVFVNNATSVPDSSIPLDSLTQVNVNGLAGNDTLIVDESNGTISLTGGIHYDGGTDSDSMTVRGGSFATETSTATGPGAGTITFGGTTITYANLTPVFDTVAVTNYTFNATAGADTFNIANGPVVGPVQTLQIGSGGSFELQNIANKVNVTLNGQGGADVFNHTATVSSTGLLTLALNGQNPTNAGDDNAADAFNLTTTLANVPTTANGGGGNDTFVVPGSGVATGSAPHLNGQAGEDVFFVSASANAALTVDGGANGPAGDTLNLNGLALDYAITASSFTTATLQPVNYTTVETLGIVNGTFGVNVTVPENVAVDLGATLYGTGAVTGNVAVNGAGVVSPGLSLGAATGIINTGNIAFTPTSTFRVQANGLLDGTEHDVLNVTGTVNLGNANLDLSAGFTAVPGDEMMIVHNDGSDPIVGKFAQGDLITIGTQKFAIDYAYDGDGDGQLNDVALVRYGAALATDPCDADKKALFVSATTGNDTIRIVPVTGNSSMRVLITNGAGTDDLGVFSPSGLIIVFGQSGDDVIKVEVPARRSWLYGQGGNDTISAGNQDSILIGGIGDDHLLGGNGKDLLIGGAGADWLEGGNGDDLLIAGSTTYDTNTAAHRKALCGIQDEWINGQGGPAGRKASLTIGGGKNGTNVLNATTVFDDSAVDRVFGQNGKDWLILNTSGAGTLDLSDVDKNDLVTDL